jgi:hypothetical protein
MNLPLALLNLICGVYLAFDFQATGSHLSATLSVVNFVVFLWCFHKASKD